MLRDIQANKQLMEQSLVILDEERPTGRESEFDPEPFFNQSTPTFRAGQKK
jgi:hypothetical protein